MARQSVFVYIPGSEREGKGEREKNDCHFTSVFEVNKTPNGCSERVWGFWDAAALQSIAHPDINTPTRWLWTWIKSHPNPDCLSTSTPSCWHWPPRAWGGSSSSRWVMLSHSPARLVPQDQPESAKSEPRAQWLSQSLRDLWLLTVYLHSCPSAAIKLVKAHNQPRYVE